MAALSLAKELDARVIATTRNPARIEPLRAAGADAAILDTGAIAAEVRGIVPAGAQTLLELVGAATLRDSLQAMAPKGVVCYMGVLGGVSQLDSFRPLAEIPSGVHLTAYASRGSIDAGRCAEPLQRMVDGVASGRLRATVGRVFPFDEIAAAHRYMEESRAIGTIVIALP
jgi:NADPH:quinone reductase-like Zn-dependent oxidoreductase